MMLHSKEVLYLKQNENQTDIHKNLETCQEIWNQMLWDEFGRDSIMINIGGGGLCDVGGFIASVYKRGIDYINIPTTLLAMVDASVGGKTAINFCGIKNAIGTFSNPKEVIVCTEMLDTLSDKEFHSGIAEMVKHSLIADGEMWNTILKNKKNVRSFFGSIEMIKHSIEIKNKIHFIFKNLVFMLVTNHLCKEILLYYF